MKGLAVWAHSYCRSTLAFYRGLGTAFGVPVEVYLFNRGCGIRTTTGFAEDEFHGMKISYLDSYEDGLSILRTRSDWNHLFGVYQIPGLYQKMILAAHESGCKVAIGSEAPCNMEPYPKRLIKEIYLRFVLPKRVRPYVEAAEFILNYSGNENAGLERNGWNPSQIVPCGYYPPAIPDSRLIERNSTHWKNFTILLTGIHQWHRSPMVLLKALNILEKRGIDYKCYITQEGPLLKRMKSYASHCQLRNVSFLGFLPLPELVTLYENCSVYVGCGSHEPWGMRLNDALQCGAPLVISDGMGGSKLIDDYRCGAKFKKGNYRQLADILESMIKVEAQYLEYSRNAYIAALNINPDNKAKSIADTIRSRFPEWIK